MKTTQRKRSKRGASILLLSFIFMALLFLIATAMYRLVPADMHAANRAHQDLTGHYVANAGIRATAAWLTDSMERFQSGGGPEVLPDYAESGETVNLTAFEDEINTGTSPFSDPDWSYEISIDVDPSTVGVSHNFQPRVFQIVSTAKYRDRPIRRVEAWIRQSTFASFAYFTDKFSGEMRIDGDLGFAGPVHTNEHFVFNVLGADQYDPSSGKGVYFGDEVTHAQFSDTPDAGGDGNVWLGEKPYDSSGPIDGRYEAIFEGGRNALRDKNSIALPSTSDDIKRVAWGGTSESRPYPSENGIYVNKSDTGVVDAGIYVRGNTDELFLGLDEVGNQQMSFENWRNTGDTNVSYGGWNPPPTPPITQQVPFVPPQYETDWVCNGNMVEVPPPPPSGGGGVGEPQGPTYECDEPLTAVQGDEIFDTIIIEEGTEGVWDPTIENTSTDWDKYEVVVVEAENAAGFKHYGQEVLDPDTGDPITVPEGSTLVATMRQDDEAPGDPWLVEEYEIIPGLPNGTIYVDGSINGNDEGWNGLHGLVKGTPETAPDGTINTDDDGNVVYNSKVIATRLDRSISISGDLLQFDPEAFAGTDASTRALFGNHKDTRHLKNAARDPGHDDPSATGPELSPTADHVLGIVTQDVWMRGRKNSHAKNGNDGYNDVYAIILAGRTHSNDEISGGFGTHYRQVNSNRGGGAMGNFQVVGGVIQGTTGQNYGGNWQTKHYWINPAGTRGYQVSMHYDKIATYQRLFPTYAEFEVIRYLETSARDR